MSSGPGPGGRGQTCLPMAHPRPSLGGCLEASSSSQTHCTQAQEPDHHAATITGDRGRRWWGRRGGGGRGRVLSYSSDSWAGNTRRRRLRLPTHHPPSLCPPHRHAPSSMGFEPWPQDEGAKGKTGRPPGPVSRSRPPRQSVREPMNYQKALCHICLPGLRISLSVGQGPSPKSQACLKDKWIDISLYHSM